MSFITRFAPSPTGDLHIGGVRTALYCWILAKKHHGKLILRIEDTDLARSNEASVQLILEGLKWLKLDWDLGPFFQSARFERYKAAAAELLAANLAYRCNCSKERLEQLRSSQLEQKLKPKYDYHCREKNLTCSGDLPYVIRFKSPRDGVTQFEDLVRGKITVANSELDDFIIIRSDHTPTYNFTVVIDDLDLAITDVIRGEDHISNTPKQINLFKAFGAKIPNYAHIPMILGEDGAKLSKRHGASSILDYKKLGILPQALINYLARLGWAHKDQEIFTLEELINLFDLSAVTKSAASLNMDKLLWLNQYYMMNSPASSLVEPVVAQLLSLGVSAAMIAESTIIKAIELYSSRVKTLREMAIEIRFLFDSEVVSLAEFIGENLKNHVDFSKIRLALKELSLKLELLEVWDPANIHARLHEVIGNFNLKFRDLALPLRKIIIGKEQSPSLDQVLALVGKAPTLNKLNQAIAQLFDI